MKFAIISPATEVANAYIDGALAELRRRGHDAIVMPAARGPHCGTYAASDASRLADLTAALQEESIDVILCARGGYGCVHLLSAEVEMMAKRGAKPIVGFSDVSALHALWRRSGVRSIHASMAKQLALCNDSWQLLPEGESRERLQKECEALSEEDRRHLQLTAHHMLSLLENPSAPLSYTLPTDSHNIPGEACGEIIGGNLAVLNGLAATPWDILSPAYAKGKIIFLEDIGEKIYQIERMLKRLQLAGTLDSAAGLIFGQFTDYNPDKNFPDMTAMISTRLKEWGVTTPTLFNAPIGHTHFNLPIPEGREARLIIQPDKCTLSFP